MLADGALEGISGVTRAVQLLVVGLGKSSSGIVRQLGSYSSLLFRGDVLTTR